MITPLVTAPKAIVLITLTRKVFFMVYPYYLELKILAINLDKERDSRLGFLQNREAFFRS
ncbi:hypothetical protein NBRC116492_23480 [Aurantivibrio infirmus]